MRLQFGLGTIENPALSQAAQYIALIGTKDKTFDQFKEELQKIGSKIEVYANSNYFGYSISGFDDYYKETLGYLNEYMGQMHVREDDRQKLSKLVENSKITRDREKKDPSAAGRALKDYALWGKKSPYLRRSTLKEVESMTPEFLIQQAKDAMKYEADIMYTGTIPKSIVIRSIKDELNISSNLRDTKSPITIDYNPHTRNKVFMIDDPEAVQSQIYILSEGKVLDMEQRSVADVFNKYFGLGMASIVFQEIREFRSLAYTARGYYINRPDVDMKGYFYGYIGTQVDKTMDAISTYIDIFKNMPQKENRLGSIRDGLTQSINTKKPAWRSQATYVSNLIKQDYKEDPNKFKYSVYKKIDFDDVIEFHKNNFKKDPTVITILTDKSKINIDKILDYGELIELNKEIIFN